MSAPDTGQVQGSKVEWADREAWELKLRTTLRTEYEALFQLWKQGELIDLEKRNDEVIKEGLKKYYDKWQEEQKPPTHEDIQSLLNQEYVEFTLKVSTRDGNDKMFTIKELPQDAEMRFFKLFKDKLIENVSSLGAFTQETIDRPFEETAKAFLLLFDQSFPILASAVVIVLNPFGEDKDIDLKWVQSNIGSDRQWRIAEAQVSVNRLKDFFLRVSQSGQATQTMMTGQRFQQLQQLAC